MKGDRIVFGLEFIRHFREVGAIMPSSRYLGRASCAYLAGDGESEGPVRVLEAGAGTGSFTCEIVYRLAVDSQLDSVELNSQ